LLLISKNMKSFFYLLLFGLIFSGCIKEDHFGKSNLKQVLFFQMSQQTGNTRIIEDSLLIRVSVSAGADLTRLRPDSVALSSYAQIEPSITTVRNFTQPVTYRVVAENGSSVLYTVICTPDAPNPQLENGSLDSWYTPAGKTYLEPGANANTIWASGNAGVVTIGSANVTPQAIGGLDNAAKMVTSDLGALGQLVGQRMAAGTIFTGSFVLDISNPISSARFGIPFSARPKSVSFAYTYSPGSPYRNGRGQTLSKQDSCDIYVLLENREQATQRIATGWLRSGESVTAFREVTLTLQYGALSANAPAYMLPANGLFGNANDKVTHFSFVAASSASGALFEGGVNSTLVINNVRLNY
jgi:hypothetical protein